MVPTNNLNHTPHILCSENQSPILKCVFLQQAYGFSLHFCKLPGTHRVRDLGRPVFPGEWALCAFAHSSYLGLFFEQLPLPHGIIQLSVSIAYLLLHDEQLKALRQTLLRAVPEDRRAERKLNIQSLNNLSLVQVSEF